MRSNTQLLPGGEEEVLVEASEEILDQVRFPEEVKVRALKEVLKEQDLLWCFEHRQGVTCSVCQRLPDVFRCLRFNLLRAVEDKIIFQSVITFPKSNVLYFLDAKYF